MSGPTTSLDEQSGSGSGERERLGRFTLLRVIGRGASATVYEAMDTRMERPVALKVLFFDPMLTPEQRQRQIERFEREARAVARLSHPNIVSVYDVGEEAGKHFLVMELLSGITLRERIEQGGPIALGEATSIVEQIASALDSTHAEGIVHRDIKPSNVLLMPDGRVKMLDFGIARRGEDATVTHTGMLIGSPAYMSPEQGRGEAASPASDIWSLGALLYEMLTGHSPFGASNVAAVLYNAAFKEPETLPEDVAQAQKVVEHALAKQPEERYASAGALAGALRVAVDFPAGPGSLKPTNSLPQAVVKQSLQNQNASLVDVPRPESTTEGTAETMHRPRSRMADLGVIAAWMAVVVVALGIVTARMRQSSAPAAARPVTSPSPATVAPTGPLPVTTAARMASPRPVRVVPSPRSSALPVRIAEVKSTPPAVKSTPAAVLPVLVPKPAATTAPRPIPRITTKALVPAPRPAPTASAKAAVKKAVVVASASDSEPPWDNHMDRLGDPEPEPTPTKVPNAKRPQQIRQNSQPVPVPASDSDSASDQIQFKTSALLGRWQGNIWKRNATLLITGSDNDSFQGTLTLKTESGPLRFRIQGSFSPVTGRLSFWSSDTPARATAAKIDLGQENGRLLSAKTMGGVGIDSDRRVFTWSFSR